MRAGDAHETVVFRHINKRYGGVDIIAINLSVSGLVVIMWIMKTIGKVKTARVAMKSLLFAFGDRTLLLQNKSAIEKSWTVPHQAHYNPHHLFIER